MPNYALGQPVNMCRMPTVFIPCPQFQEPDLQSKQKECPKPIKVEVGTMTDPEPPAEKPEEQRQQTLEVPGWVQNFVP